MQKIMLAGLPRLLLPGVALLACAAFLTSQQNVRDVAAQDVAYLRHEIVEDVHGLESWLRHPHSKHHVEPADDAGPASWSELGRDVDLFMKRVERLERPDLASLTKQVKQEEQALRAEERKDRSKATTHTRHNAKPGQLTCEGKQVDHEIIYWKKVPGDQTYESPITPHHDEHDQKYLTFEYDAGGWNNVRMGVECVVVFAHATGRTLVAPPAQNLYLLGAPNPHAQRRKLGFNDFFVSERLKDQGGMHMISMAEFLKRQQAEVNVARRPNATDFWGQKLWRYLKKSADVKPEYSGQIVAMGRLHATAQTREQDAKALKKQAAGRRVAAYDSHTRDARHVHFPAGGKHRLLNHFYAFGFFGDPAQRSFYRRLIRDSMRYRDEIQCAGAKVVDAVRAHSRRLGNADGTFYALHIRRGDFQFKEVKISAGQIVENLRGHSIIPRGALVYLATDGLESASN